MAIRARDERAGESNDLQDRQQASALLLFTLALLLFTLTVVALNVMDSLAAGSVSLTRCVYRLESAYIWSTRAQHQALSVALSVVVMSTLDNLAGNPWRMCQ